MVVDLLHIQLLGDFRLTVGDELVTAINSPRMQSLLTYLLVHRGAPQPRYHLAFLLWPDSPEAQARSNLRNLLHRLRHAFPTVESFLLEDNRDLCWRVDGSYTFDVADFEQLLVKARQAEEAGDQDDLLAILEQAVGLYTGDLLPSCYDEWILIFREQLRQSFLGALENLSILYENRRSYRQAINSAQRLLRYDPLQEAIYRRLMQLLALSGDRAGALRVYQTCATVLKRELDVDPDTATRMMYEALLVADKQAEPISPPRTAPAVPARHNLPDPLTSFIGRSQEIASIKELLQRNRLLTLTGTFGSGKTRLALEAAAQTAASKDRFQDGVWFVELASITDPSLVPQVVGTELGIREKPGESLTRCIIETLQERSVLLLLDNCEHLIAACRSLVTSLLRSCPNLYILATSREPLGVMGEILWQVPPLNYPTAADEEVPIPAAQYESVILFAERAATVLPTFQLTRKNAAAVAQICRRLEGIPLAIELAAARVKMMSVEQIAARLDDALHLLRANWGGELPHHQALQAAIDWSYDLLSEKEKVLLRRLSVFSGGFTLEAAEQVAGFQQEADKGDPEFSLSPRDILDLLSHLIDKSLVVVAEQENTGEVRYRLLEVVKQYARERLMEAAELEPTLSWQANYFVTLVKEAAPKLRSAEQERWTGRLDQEYDNLRAALAWAVRHADSSDAGLLLAAGLWQYWDVRGYFTEGRRWLEQVLANSPGHTITRAKALNAAGGLAWGQGDYTAARAYLSESLEIQQEIGSQRDIAAGCLNLGILSTSQGDYPSARLLLEKSLGIFREIAHQPGIANVLNSLGNLLSDLEDYTTARVYFEESLALRREMGDKRGIAIVLANLGVAAWRQDDCQAARPLLQESLQRYRELGDKRGAATTLNELGRIAIQSGELSLAQQLLQESLAVWRELGNKEGIASFLEGTAGLASAWCDDERAARLLGASAALRERIAAPIAPADQKEYNHLLNQVRGKIDEQRHSTLWIEGRMLSLESAIDAASDIHLQPGCLQAETAV